MVILHASRHACLGMLGIATRCKIFVYIFLSMLSIIGGINSLL